MRKAPLWFLAGLLVVAVPLAAQRQSASIRVR